MSEREFSALTYPYSKASLTTGGKKSTVVMSDVVSLTAVTAASSGAARPTSVSIPC